jgi:hypothetical protein
MSFDIAPREKGNLGSSPSLEHLPANYFPPKLNTTPA